MEKRRQRLRANRPKVIEACYFHNLSVEGIAEAVTGLVAGRHAGRAA
jgi:hypothetical protein